MAKIASAGLLLALVGAFSQQSLAERVNDGVVGEACYGDKYETDENMNEGNRITDEEILRLLNPPQS